jgi:hypothetical protein
MKYTEKTSRVKFTYITVICYALYYTEGLCVCVVFPVPLGMQVKWILLSGGYFPKVRQMHARHAYQACSFTAVGVDIMRQHIMES